jgi:mono/diheme cytochrome c family protein
MKTLIVIILGGTILAAQTPAQSQPKPAPPPSPSFGAAGASSIEKGRLGFVKVGCAQCHGREAQGSPTTGPRLGPNGLPYQAFARYVREPRLQMPPYTQTILSDADLADLYAFVQSRPKPVTPPALQ